MCWSFLTVIWNLFVTYCLPPASHDSEDADLLFLILLWNLWPQASWFPFVHWQVPEVAWKSSVYHLTWVLCFQTVLWLVETPGPQWAGARLAAGGARLREVAGSLSWVFPGPAAAGERPGWPGSPHSASARPSQSRSEQRLSRRMSRRTGPGTCGPGQTLCRVRGSAQWAGAGGSPARAGRCCAWLWVRAGAGPGLTGCRSGAAWAGAVWSWARGSRRERSYSWPWRGPAAPPPPWASSWGPGRWLRTWRCPGCPCRHFPAPGSALILASTPGRRLSSLPWAECRICGPLS